MKALVMNRAVSLKEDEAQLQLFDMPVSSPEGMKCRLKSLHAGFALQCRMKETDTTSSNPLDEFLAKQSFGSQKEYNNDDEEGQGTFKGNGDKPAEQ